MSIADDMKVIILLFDYEGLPLHPGLAHHHDVPPD